MLNLDTHILLFALDGSLTPAERKLLASEPWGISAIVLWEVAKLAQLGRIAIDVRSAEFDRIFARVRVWPLQSPPNWISPAIPLTNWWPQLVSSTAFSQLAVTALQFLLVDPASSSISS